MQNGTIKFTSDGKKVIVLGNLNSQEKIVQEIFVHDGSEIPSGEHFVVKSLHDNPTVSWKEKHLKEIEDKYESTYKSKEAEFEKMTRDFDLKTKVVKEKLSFLRKLESTFNEADFETFANFITGNVEYLVVVEYSGISIIKFDSKITTQEYNRFESLKLISAFGRSDGKVNYRISHYSDGSGGNTEVFPCKNYESALILLNEKFNEAVSGNGLTDSFLECAKKYEVVVSDDIMKQYIDKKEKQIQEQIAQHEKQIAKYKEKLSSLK